MPAARFLQICDTVLKAYEREQRQQFIYQAYNAWQIIEVVKGIASDKVKGIAFTDYVKKLGLLPKEKIDPAKIEQEKKQALSIAEQIRAADRAALERK